MRIGQRKLPTKKDKAAKPGRGRPPKDGKAAPDKAKPPKPRDKKSQSKPAPEKPAVDKGGAPAGAEVTPEPSAPRDATRAEKEEIVYLNLSDLHPFKNHPVGVRDDAEMQGLVESVKAAGGRSAALVRPREDNGYFAPISIYLKVFHASGRNCALHKNREKRKVRIIPDLQNHLWKTASVCFASVNSKLSAQHERRDASKNALL